MPRLWRKIRKTVRTILGNGSRGTQDKTLWDVFARHQRLAKEVSPLQPYETAAATLVYSKTAAILFDRIWIAVNVWDPEAPKEVLFASPGATGLQHIFNDPVPGISYTRGLQMRAVDEEIQFFSNVDTIQRELGRPIVPLYASKMAYCKTYSAGKKEMLALAMSNLPFIKESSLDWEQVMEARRDKKSRDSIRRFFQWADESMIGKPISVMTDEISQRFEDYKEALRKHAVETTPINTLSAIIDATPKMGAVAAAVHFAHLGDFLATVAGSGIAIADIAIKMAKVRLSYEEGLSKLHSEHREVAFLAPLAGSE